MIKKFLTLSAVLLLISCQGKMQTIDADEAEKIEEIADDKVPYQTVENEEQAAALDKATAAQIQEIEVKDRVLFGYDSAELSDEAKKILDDQVAWLKSDSAIKITVEGHCDERGTREYNIALGETRANAAKNYLVTNGVSESRIKTISYGKERPAFFGTSEELLSKNRRAVAVVE